MSIEPDAKAGVPSEPGSWATTVLDGRIRDVGHLSVRRVLPSGSHRMVGPFVFFDEMGDLTLRPGEGIDVPPHPHIGLATVTYLFKGEVLHRDSLGSEQLIVPGDINWMIAGRGIVHSERTPAEPRARGSRIHALQLWVALPGAKEEMAPSFQHHPSSTLPVVVQGRVKHRVLAGRAFDVESPVEVLSPLFYVDTMMEAGSQFSLPEEFEERAVYVVDGAVQNDAVRASQGQMVVFAPGMPAAIHADCSTRLVLIGGAPMDGRRFIDWNFVSSSKDRLDQAKRDWKTGEFPKVPGDEHDFMPLPE